MAQPAMPTATPLTTHGRLVRRRVFASTEAAALEALSGWPGLRTVLAVESIRSVNSAPTKVESETRYFLSSCPDSPAVLGQAVRSHWAVEVVFTQLAKPDVFAVWAGGQHVSDFDVGVGDDHAVDEQQHELATLLEAGLSQSALHTPAERLQRRRDAGELLLARGVAA